jgi:response regulator RpfG family c-di-GMP phosphodiesterase
MKKVGILTNSKHFTSLFTELKKRKINVKILDIGDNYFDCDVIVVDLSFPLSYGFTFLEEANVNFLNSEKIFLVTIAEKSELLKLRTIGLKVDGHISSEIEVSKFIEKVNTLRNPESRTRLKLNRVSQKIDLKGELSHISESGALITGPISFEKGTQITLTAELLEELGINDKIICKVLSSNPIPGKKYVTEVDFVNLNDSDRDNIRKMIYSWGIE